MKNFLFAVLLLLTVQVYANHDQSAGSKSETPKLVEVVLTLPLEDLIVSPDGILVNYQGNLLPVHALVKNGEQWTIRAGGEFFKCLNGHWRACPQCGGCADPECLYYCDGYCCQYGS